MSCFLKDGNHHQGIVNPGSLCFLIAIVQQLYMIRSFRENILHNVAPAIDIIHSHLRQSRSDDEAVERKQFSLYVAAMKQLVNLFQALHDNQKSGLDTATITATFTPQENISTSISFAIDLAEEEEEISTGRIHITSFYRALQRALKKEVDIHKPRDASECFGDICKLFNVCFQSKYFQQCIVENEGNGEVDSVTAASSVSVPVSVPVSPIQELFHGELHTILQPAKSNPDHWGAYSSLLMSRTERFHYLSVDIDSGNIYDSLKAFMKSQFIQFKWRLPTNPATETNTTEPTEAMGKDRNGMTALLTEKQTLVKTWPSVLVIHLNRFTYSLQYKCKLKLFDFFQFPMVFDAREVLETEGSTQGEEEALYDLVGVTIHEGDTAYDGHYYSIIKSHQEREGEGEGGSKVEWLVFNDERVCRYEKDSLEEFYGVKYDNDDEENSDEEDNKKVDTVIDCETSKAVDDEEHKDSDDSDDGSDEDNTSYHSAFLLFYVMRSTV